MKDLDAGVEICHRSADGPDTVEASACVRRIEERPSSSEHPVAVLGTVGAAVGGQASWIGVKLGALGFALTRNLNLMDQGCWGLTGGELWLGYPSVLYAFVAINSRFYLRDGFVTAGLGIRRKAFRFDLAPMAYLEGGSFTVMHEDVEVGQNTRVRVMYRRSSEVEPGAGNFLDLTHVLPRDSETASIY